MTTNNHAENIAAPVVGVPSSGLGAAKKMALYAASAYILWKLVDSVLTLVFSVGGFSLEEVLQSILVIAVAGALIYLSIKAMTKFTIIPMILLSAYSCFVLWYFLSPFAEGLFDPISAGFAIVESILVIGLIAWNWVAWYRLRRDNSQD